VRRDQGFVLAPLRIGKLYMVRGGHIMRLQGVWGSDNKLPPAEQCYIGRYNLALSHPSRPVDPPAVGYSASHDDLRLLTAQDLAWLPRRAEMAKAKHVEYRDAEIAIEELTGNL
jgi:hypothetical protein